MATEDIQGKIIVMTGASSGFGRGAAIRFAHSGAQVVIAARRGEALEDLVDECRVSGIAPRSVVTDVSLMEDVAELAAQTYREFGRIDVWINNAGAGAIGRFEDIPLDVHQQVIDTNLMGTLYGSYYAMRLFREQGAGTLINISSIVGKIPMAYYSSYAAAKHAVVGLSAAIRAELEEDKIDSIHVCTVLPMSTDTPFFEHAANFSGHKPLPTPPVYDPQDVIDVIVGLATEPEDEVAVGVAGKMAVLAHNLAPGITESMMAKSTHKTLTEAPPAEDTEGGLMEPSPRGTTIRSSDTAKGAAAAE